MKIQKVPPRRSPLALLQERPIWYMALIFLAVAGGFAIHQQGWHRPVYQFLQVASHEPSFVYQMLFHRPRIPTLAAEMRFNNYTALLGQREQALRNGARVAGETDYVPALLSVNGVKATARLRLPEGPATIFQGDRWPLEIVLDENAGLWKTGIPLSPCADQWQPRDPSGRSLRQLVLAPADANTLSLWVYLETLCRNDLLALRAFPVRLVLNGSDRGLYILQEKPTAEWLSLQGKGESTLLGWNRQKYWEAYAQLNKMMPGSGVAYAQMAEIGPVGEPITPSLRIQHNASLPLDPEPTGRFLALTTLWQGILTPDWRAMYLACDSRTSRCEPVAGAALFPPAPSETFLDDPAVQIAYARAIAQFGNPDFLNQLQAELEPSLKTLQLALASGGIYAELPWPTLRQHQAAMRALVDPTIGIQVTAEATNDAMSLEVCNLMPFPVAIVNVDIGELQNLPIQTDYVADAENRLIETNFGAVVIRAKALSSGYPTCIHLRIPGEDLPITGYRYEEIRVGIRVVGIEATPEEIPAQPPVRDTRRP